MDLEVKYVCFDTNYLLAILIPLDTWKEIIKLCEKEITTLVEEQKIKVVITDQVKEEAKKRMYELVIYASQQFKKLFHLLKDTDLKKPFNQESILKFRKELQLILRDTEDKVHRNQWYFYEDFILKAIRRDSSKSKKRISNDCLTKMNEMLTRINTELIV